MDTITKVLEWGVPNMDGARIELSKYRCIDPTEWERLLEGYFDRDELVSGLRFGWDFSLAPDPDPRDAPANLPSATEFPDSVDEYVATELSFGALVGPLPPDLPFRVWRNPLGSVPKVPPKRRTITDCSQRGAGINSWIRHDWHRGKYVETNLPGTTHICAAIRRTRLRFPAELVLLFKLDYSRFYRQFLNCPSQSPFLCIMWKEEIFLDRCWCFGNRGCCQSSQRFSAAVSWFFRCRVPPAPGVANSGLACRCPHTCLCGDNECCPYIDDSIAIVVESNATWLYNSFIELTKKLTLQLSTTPGHISPPSTTVVALGVEYDTRENRISLPQAKLEALLALLQEWLDRDTATSRELASLVGKLLWAAQVVPPGRLFLGRALALKRQVDAQGGGRYAPKRPTQLDQDFKLDIRWWFSMVRGWNGRSFLEARHTGDVATDASSHNWYDGGPGLGAFSYVNNQYFATGVPAKFKNWNICDLELLVILIAVRVWGPGWAGYEVDLLTDNESCRHLLLGGKSRDSGRLAMARLIVGEQFRGGFRVSPSRITTEKNTLADALSRLGDNGKWELFHQTVAGYGAVPTRINLNPSVFNLDPTE